MAVSKPLVPLVCALVAGSFSRTEAAFPCERVLGVEGRGRIPIVFFPEAFTEPIRAEYDTAVAQAITRFLGVTPYKEYRDYFAIYKAWIPSQGDYVGSTPSQNTLFHAYYPGTAPGMTGTEPHLWTEVDTSFRCLDRSPDFLKSAISVIFVRQFTMSGSGVTYNSRLTVLLGSTGFSQVLPHELGHALGALVDEYGPSGSNPGHSHFDSLGNPLYGPVPNIASSLAAGRIPWAAWIAPGTPIPTPDSSPYDTVIGAFEGGDLRNTGRWRPARQCMMRGTDAFHLPPFCKVCREAIVNQILRDSSQMERLVAGRALNHLRLDAVDPPAGTDLASGQVVVRFPRADPTPLHPRWRYNGTELSSQTDTLDLADLQGSGDLEAILEGSSPFIRDPALVPRDTLRWTVRRSTGLASPARRDNGIRRIGPGLFLVPAGVPLPRQARNAAGRTIALEAVATTAQGTLVEGRRAFGECLFLDR